MHRALAFMVVLAGCTDEHVYPLDELPVEEWTGGLPIEGDGRLLVWLARTDWSNAVGFVRFRCDDCRLGDGVAKMTVAGFDQGIEFPGIELGSVYAALDFADGTVKMTTTWRSDSFVLDGEITGKLAARAEDIELAGCVRFRATDALRTQDPIMYSIVTLTGAPQDGDMFSVKLEGTLGKMRRLGQVCSIEQVR
jgi:hypothetical protein